MQPSKIEITRHAWDRLVSRWPGDPPACYKQELQRLWDAREPDALGWGSVVRAIDNKMEEARYFKADGWRIVTDAREGVIITIERIIHGEKKPSMLPRKRTRQQRRRQRWEK